MRGKIGERKEKFYHFSLCSIRLEDREVPLFGKASLFLKDPSLSPADLIEVDGILTPFSYPKNPNLFDQNTHLRRQGFVGRLHPKEIRVIKKGKVSLPINLIHLFRQYAERTIGTHLVGNERLILSGLLFGEKEGLPYEVKGYFAKSGLYHILAVSGLHIGILAFSLLIFFSVIRLDRWLRGFLITLLLLFYLAVVGFPPSATRATIMFLLLIFSFLLQRKTDLLHPLAIACFLILFFAPSSLFLIGFQLSFLATGFILLFAQRIYGLVSFVRSRFWKRYLFFPLSLSFAAFLGTFPLVWYYFYRIPFFAIIANLFILPLVGFALPQALLILFLSLFSFPLAQFISPSLNLSLNLILEITQFFGSLPLANLTFPKPPLLSIFWIYLLILLLLKFKDRRIKKLWFFLFLGGANYFLWLPIIKNKKETTLTFLDTYRSEPILIERGNRNFLIFTGEWDGLFESFLTSKGVKEIEALFIPKTGGGVKRIIREAKRFNVKQIFLPKGESLSSGEIVRVEKDGRVTFSEMEFLFFAGGNSFNLLFKTNQREILFYYNEERSEARGEVIKVGSNLRREAIEAIMERKGVRYLVFQRKRFTDLNKNPRVLATTSHGAVVMKIGKGLDIRPLRKPFF